MTERVFEWSCSRCGKRLSLDVLVDGDGQPICAPCRLGERCPVCGPVTAPHACSPDSPISYFRFEDGTEAIVCYSGAEFSRRMALSATERTEP